MRDSEKLIKFKQGLKKGKEGVPDNFEAWLEIYGIDFKKLSSNFVQDKFSKNPIYMIGNEDEIESIGEYLGLFLRNRRSFYHIPVIGIKGSGKSLLLAAIQHFIVQSGEKIKYQFYDASKFYIDKNEKLIYNNNEINQEKQDLIFIDSCEKDSLIFDSLTLIFEKMGNAVYITAWTPEVFEYWSQDIKYSFPFSRKIVLHPIENHNFQLKVDRELRISPDITRLFRNINNIICFKNAHNNEDYRDISGDNSFYNINSLFKYSKGVPLIFIKLFFASIREVFIKRRENLEVKTIEDAAKKIGLISIPKKLSNLSQPQLRLLEAILIFSTEEGINPTKLAYKLKLDKSTISYHLNSLKEENILESLQTGRTVFYKIKEIIVPFVQMRILIEFDYLNLKQKEKLD